MGGSGGGSNQQSSSTSHLPAWAQPYAKQFLGAGMGQMLPGGLPAQSPLPYNQQAPFTNDQLAAMGMTEQLSGPESQYLQGAQGQLNQFGSGQYANLSQNPYFQGAFNAAAAPITANYEQAIAPNILSNAVAAGGLGSSGSEQAFANAQNELASNLSQLGQSMALPAYEQGLQQMQQAQEFAPSMAGAQYLPSQVLGGVGGQQQQQAQDILNTGAQNLSQNAMFPYQALQMFGPLLGQAIGNAGTTINTNPNPSQTSK